MWQGAQSPLIPFHSPVRPTSTLHRLLTPLSNQRGSAAQGSQLVWERRLSMASFKMAVRALMERPNHQRGNLALLGTLPPLGQGPPAHR